MRRTGLFSSSTSMRRAAAGGLGALLAVGATAVTSPASAEPAQLSAVIVQLTAGSDAAAEAVRATAEGGTVSYVYEEALSGFAGEFTPQAIAEMEQNPNVELVEPDGVFTATDVQTGPVWNLDRVDEHTLPMDGLFGPTSDGSGVTAYVIDTGIAPHPEFGARLQEGTSTLKGDKTTADCNGHGTHVAGTIAGTTYGVAKQATLVPVRVLDCRGSGSWSGVVAGIEWAVSHHEDGVPAVANMSFGGPASSTIDDAVSRLIDDGVTVTVAAGNEDADPADFSPAGVPDALTVGATDRNDARAAFSNHGAGIDLFAPGVGVTSAWLNGGTNTISGTSMAAPHVTGAAAIVLSRSAATSTYTPVEVAEELQATATPDVVVDEAGSPDRLLFVGPADTPQ